jgi:hypothetical protein
MPLAAADLNALRAAEAKLRAQMREQSGLSKLGPGAVELAAFMDATTSFLLVKAPGAVGLKALAGSGGRLAAPLVGLPSPGENLIGTYAMTTVLFNSLIADRSGHLAGTQDPTEKCPCSKSVTLDPTTDEVTVNGNKGTITTTMSATAMVNGSKVSVDIKIKVEGEVRDAKTGAVLFKIASESTGHADGDACPDASGVANASMAFTGNDDNFDATGARTGSSAINFSGRIRMRVDDNAKLAGVDITPTGGGVLGAELIRLAAQSAAPEFEKAWRSGMCIEVLVDPATKDVEAESVTSITAKVKHKIEGNELDKPVEAKLSSGVKSIDPSGSKVKSPATFKYTAGPESGDQGTVGFESVSNRGIGRKGGVYTVTGGWTVSSTGTSVEDFQGGVVANNFSVSITDMKIKADKDGTLSGTGTITFSGEVSTGAGICRGHFEQTIPFKPRGTLVGTGPTAVLRMVIDAPSTDKIVNLTCILPTGATSVVPLGTSGYSERYGEALGEIELPADGGTKTFSRTKAIGGVMNVATNSTFTVVKAKK